MGTRMAASQYVFAYGSLATDRRGDGFLAELPGYARGWGVAMDNRCDLPGYKWYAEPGGTRPAVFVAFLDLHAIPGSRVGGLCVPVSDTELRGLDTRERNYVRVEISAELDCGARVWTYLGSAAGRARFAAGRAGGRAVIDAAYRDAVARAFRDLGRPAWCESLAARGLPVRKLIRHALP
jgi:hypothetical protein